MATRLATRAADAALPLALASLVTAGAAAAENLRFTPILRGDVTYSNNVKLAPDDLRQSDFAFSLVPGFEIDYKAARASLRGYVEVPVYWYAKLSEENRAIPRADLNGKLEVVQKFFFVDAAASASEAYYSPFGTRPATPVNPSLNEYRYTSYRVSPYIEGLLGGNVRYLLRDDNLWTRTYGLAVGDERQYTNHLRGSLARDPAPFGWRAEIDRAEYRFDQEQRKQTLALVRALGLWQPDAAWRVYASAGYEDNKFPLSRSEGAIYGAGVLWRPTDRTSVDLGWEDRFFGASYRFAFEHRLPRAVISAGATRNITSYPETVASLPAGGFVPGLLNQALQSRIPDPAQRAEFVANYIAANGLPLFLSDPLAIYNQQVYLETRAHVTVGLLGARNTLFVNGWRLKTQPIAGSGDVLPPLVLSASDNTQLGLGVTWGYKLTPATSTTLALNWARDEANQAPFEVSELRGARFTVTHPLTPRTSLVGGVGWQDRRGDGRSDYSETSVFLGFAYRGI